MSGDASGAGRRLTAGEESRAAGMFAAGSTDRQVADALECGAATANRLRHRLADRIAELQASVGQDAAAAGDVAHPAVQAAEEIVAAEHDVVLAELGEERGQLASRLAGLDEAAGKTRAAVTQLEVERREALARRGDLTGFASRRREALDVADDLERAGDLLREDLAAVDAQIGTRHAELAAQARQERQAEAQQRAAEARAEGDKLAPVAAAALRGAVLGEVAAAELVRVVSRLTELEQLAGASWDEEILPPQLQGARDTWHLQVCALWRAARAGQAAGCQKVLAALGGQWAERDRGQFAADREAAAERARQAQAEANDRMRRGRLVGGPAHLPERPGMGAARPPQLAQANVHWQGAYSDGPPGAAPAG